MFPIDTPDACPMAVADDDGILGPCDRPTTGWAWYDGPEHEPSLTRACSRHETPGADDIAALAAAALPVPQFGAPDHQKISIAFALAGLTLDNGYTDAEMSRLTAAAMRGEAMVEELRPCDVPTLPWLLFDILDWWLAEIRFNGGETSETLDDINRIVAGTDTFTIDDAHSDRSTYSQACHLLAVWTRLTVGLEVRVETVAGQTVIVTKESS